MKLFSGGKKQCNDLTATPSVTEWQMSKLKPSLENHSIWKVKDVEDQVKSFVISP